MVVEMVAIQKIFCEWEGMKEKSKVDKNAICFFLNNFRNNMYAEMLTKKFKKIFTEW